MEKCPLNGQPCIHKKCIHVTDVGKDYKATEVKDMCVLCGLDYVQNEEGKSLPTSEQPVQPSDIMNFIIKNKMKPVQMAQTKTCPTCGYGVYDISTIGRLGCPDCYETFRQELEPLLLTCHRSLKHVGKRPKNIKQPEATLEQLEAKMQEAIKEENYEEAAKLRDEIKNRKAK